MEATASVGQLLDSLRTRKSTLMSVCQMRSTVLEDMEKSKREQMQKLDETIREGRNRVREVNTEVSATDDHLFVINNIAEKVRTGEALKSNDMEAIKKAEELLRELPEAEDWNTDNNLPSTGIEPITERKKNSSPKWHIEFETSLTCGLDGRKYWLPLHIEQKLI